MASAAGQAPAKIAQLPGSAYYLPDFVTPAEEAYSLDKFNTRPASAFRNLARRRLQVYPAELHPRTSMLPAGPLPDWVERPIVERLLRTSVAVPGPADVAVPANVGLEAGDRPRHVFADSPHQRPTHALLNEYEAGTGIAAHEDGPAYFPLVCTVSLGSHAVLELRRKDGGGPATAVGNTAATSQTWRVLQEPRSLLVLGQDLYRGYLHEIRNVAFDENLKPWDAHDGSGQGVVNWDLLGQETRDMLGETGGRWARGTRVSVTLRDVLKMRDFGRLVPGLRRGA